MRPRTLIALATAGLAVAAPVASAATGPGTRGASNPYNEPNFGTGAAACTITPGAACAGVRQHHAHLRGSDLRGAHFEGAHLHGVDLRGARLQGAKFGPPRRAVKRAHQAQPAPSCYPNCSGADLSHANLSWAHLNSADFTHANLTRADLSNAHLNQANLTSANLTRANVSGVFAYGVKLVSATLVGASLSGAAMVGANLTNANLASADLSGAAFLAANLASANVTGATWYRTTCPNGTVTSTGCI